MSLSASESDKHYIMGRDSGREPVRHWRKLGVVYDVSHRHAFAGGEPKGVPRSLTLTNPNPNTNSNPNPLRVLYQPASLSVSESNEHDIMGHNRS